ncbi:MAG: hypothetical protein K2N21_01085 [Rikenellaceae bacterium]|nr:hypothetical protein [Rikenellaceae bacterium]
MSDSVFYLSDFALKVPLADLLPDGLDPASVDFSISISAGCREVLAERSRGRLSAGLSGPDENGVMTLLIRKHHFPPGIPLVGILRVYPMWPGRPAIVRSFPVNLVLSE